jgi:two-component system sensor histidine kinase KdpD
MEKEAVKEEEKEHTLKLYNTLLNSLSHELRTPISTIIGAADNLQANSIKLTEQNRLELVSEISSASFRLNQQVENLLSMSRLEAGVVRLKKDWCDMNELVYNVVRRLEQDPIAQRIRININPGIPLVMLDKGMIEQVLYNLLLNAAQYTVAGTTIDVIAGYHINTLEIVIEDNGEGFPATEIKKVFDKFYRLKNSKAGGTGLGLSIVKGFVEAHNGSVKLENVAAGGARFTIEIPAEASYLQNLKNE